MGKELYHKIDFSRKTFLTCRSRLEILVVCLQFASEKDQQNTTVVLTASQSELMDMCISKIIRLMSIITTIVTVKREEKYSSEQMQKKSQEFYNILNYLSGVADALMLPISINE